MRFFILDDDPNIVHILKMIIKDKELGAVVGEANDGDKGMREIRSLNPDIVLIDLLMPGIDGLTIVKQIKEKHPEIEFIMISQVYEKKMVEKAYRYGVEYYIYKPINAIEVEMIIKKVIEVVDINNAFFKVMKKIDDEATAYNPKSLVEDSGEICKDKANHILIDLGIMGENGTDDIIKIIDYVISNDIDLKNVTMNQLCSVFTDNPRSMEQRIRRALNLAMINIANLGIEDHMNEIFVQYSNSLFNFEQVRKEMEVIRGNSKDSGSVNIKKFLIGLATYCKYMKD